MRTYTIGRNVQIEFGHNIDSFSMNRKKNNNNFIQLLKMNGHFYVCSTGLFSHLFSDCVWFIHHKFQSRNAHKKCVYCESARFSFWYLRYLYTNYFSSLFIHFIVMKREKKTQYHVQLRQNWIHFSMKLCEGSLWYAVCKYKCNEHHNMSIAQQQKHKFTLNEYQI